MSTHLTPLEDARRERDEAQAAERRWAGRFWRLLSLGAVVVLLMALAAVLGGPAAVRALQVVQGLAGGG